MEARARRRPAGLADPVRSALATALAVTVRSDGWLRLYKYTWAAAGVALLLATFLFGDEVNGERLSLAIGPFSGQPSELLKVILVVFLAGYLSENRPLLVEETTKVGPDLAAAAPVPRADGRDVGDRAGHRRRPARPRRRAPVLRRLPVAALRRDRPASATSSSGSLLFLVGAFVLYQLFGTSGRGSTSGSTRSRTRSGDGYQIVQALYAFGRGGLLGTGLGAGLPTVGGSLPIPAVHTDFPLAALGEELGLIGLLAILGLYLVVIERGLRIAAAAADDFRALLAAGLALVVGVQAFIIAAGNLKLIPLTGITLPFISYGGSSLLANAVIVGLLLALSDRGVEPPPPPRPRGGSPGSTGRVLARDPCAHERRRAASAVRTTPTPVRPGARPADRGVRRPAPSAGRSARSGSP